MDVSGLSQRWKRRRATWAPVRSVIDPDRYEVVVISDSQARTFCETNHYSGSIGACRLACGLLRRETGGEKELVGVAVFGVLMQPAAAERWCSRPCLEVPDLNRLCLLDKAEFNAESFFVARALRLLRERVRGVRALISYTDPVPRFAADGRQVLRGHVGQCYQALGMRFVGWSSARNLIMNRDGRVVSGRSLSKLRNGERGADYVARQLFMAGAPPRRFGESGREYHDRALAEGPFTKVKHPGNLVYVHAIDDGRDVTAGLAPALPYLKRSDLNL